jgi:hypothetical protein
MPEKKLTDGVMPAIYSGRMPGDDWDRFVVLSDHLKRRRNDSSQAMWLAPVLVITGQAFLLEVLSRGGPARGWVLAVGIAACAAGVVTLGRGRAREMEYAEAIAHYWKEKGLPELRSGYLPRAEPPTMERRQRSRSGWWPVEKLIGKFLDLKWTPSAPLCWTVALVLFAVADFAMFCAA